MLHPAPALVAEEVLGDAKTIEDATAVEPEVWRLRLEADDGTVRLAVSGELDLATAPELDRALRDAQRRARLVVLDLRRLTFVDGTGLRVLLAAADRARVSATRFRVVPGPPHVDRLLALTGVDGQLEMIGHRVG